MAKLGSKPALYREKEHSFFSQVHFPAMGDQGLRQLKPGPQAGSPCKCGESGERRRWGNHGNRARGGGHRERPWTTIFPVHLAQESQADMGQPAGSRESSDKVKRVLHLGSHPGFS